MGLLNIADLYISLLLAEVKSFSHILELSVFLPPEIIFSLSVSGLNFMYIFVIYSSICVHVFVIVWIHMCLQAHMDVCVKLTLDVFFRVSLPSALRQSLLLNPDLLSLTRLASGLLWRFLVSASNRC